MVKLFHDRARFDAVEQNAAEPLAVEMALIYKPQNGGKGAEFQPVYRIEADFENTVVDFADAPRGFEPFDRIDPDDDQVTFRHPEGRGSA